MAYVPGVSRSLVIVVVVCAAGAAVAQDRGRVIRRHPSLDGVGAFNHVEARTTVVTCPKVEGARVREGEIVCELDPAPLEDVLRMQVISTRGAEASCENAKLNRVVAEIAAVEYLEGVYKQEEQTARGEIALPESDLKRAEDRVEWSNRMFALGYISLGENLSDKLSLQPEVV